MESSQSILRSSGIVCVCVLILGISAQPGVCAEVGLSADNAYLDALQAHANDYIGHWLDRFGAAGARVVATGQRQGEKLVILFPYAAGAFKDTFVFDAKANAWSLVIESQAPGGTWSNFATYTLVRPASNQGH